MNNRQRSIVSLSSLTRTVALIATLGIVVGFLVLVATSGIYGATGLVALGYVLLGVGGTFVPLAFVIGALSLHAQAITPELIQAPTKKSAKV